MRKVLLLCVVSVLPAATTPAFAQEAAEPDPWEFTIAPYFLAPYMSGEITVHGLNVTVDANPGDILDKLQFGAMLYLEARKGPWAIGADGLYMNLKQSAERNDTEVGAKQAAIELSGLRRVTPAVEVLLSGRINLLEASITFPTPDEAVSQKKTWVDPVVGVRLHVPGNSPLIANLRADIGGFGLGSELAWQLYPMIGYRFSKLFAVIAAYRVLDMKYETGEGDDLFIYDVTTFGPELGVVFHF